MVRGGGAARGHPAPRGPPRPGPRRLSPRGPRGEPLLGSLRRLRSDPLGLFVEAAAQHGDLVSFRALHRRLFLAVGGDAIAHVTVGNRENYTKGVSYDALRVVIGDALLTMDG